MTKNSAQSHNKKKQQPLYAGLGLILGAGVGFSFGGPVGAAMGAAIGLILGAGLDASQKRNVDDREAGGDK